MVIFDAELRLLRHQKLKLDIMMKTADLRHITWFEELLLLKNFEKHEDTLQERVNILSSEEEEMRVCENRIHTKSLGFHTACPKSHLVDKIWCQSTRSK